MLYKRQKSHHDAVSTMHCNDETFFFYFSSYPRGQLVSIGLARKLWKGKVFHEDIKLIEEAFSQMSGTVQVVRY